ncbi:peptide deformylase [Buchnera aphidicola str. APS (Acyrthosiphon pisum)]|uniref:Peptide deformylase n=3 Tax=Buchnera aphidicola TaxID=9 RepID=DEF_BUCAI|nr:peptide deformylase [Buchnera aphidicola]B8D821.1 RecName: Full=Peptide deformylase; Short=PDF; AltName: Full=Polypeptide deformylase [Buchnera aphidicola str. Tuc7 (Acyrthosiphon pisum)]B8D9R9.1 RecName: Full=Peptide deformylase; Short=PDF; AltName: Full=Polypeptide deformylase [Buchnera aphidicola str. 5A (Acyrthosiphon pisum)]P57563.1 RecName: Full=Peptide deformylase; Short=PDF; AltName: Full=Polypeptide deformylase [Buchnera aphidicola str. APS (Acyrthosiphon pisum)]pir/E84987/ formylme
MSLLKILYYPDIRLRILAKPVKEINKKIQKIANDMIDTMYQEEGIGLAATQVNIPLQIIVVNTMEQKKNNLVLINPKIIKKEGDISIEEGCLSIPEYQASIPRSNYIQVQAVNLDGEKIEIEAKSILSICIQHEIDHLKGKLFIDYLSKFKRERIQKKFEKINKKNKKFSIKE